MLTTIKILAVLNLVAFMLSVVYQYEKIANVTVLIFLASALLSSVLALTL